MSKDEIYIMKLKNIAAFPGNEIQNNGNIKMICYVLIMAHK